MEIKKGIILSIALTALLLINCVSALDLTVEKVEKIPVVISELKNPAIFEFIINNNGAGENVEIYSLVGVSFEPREKFFLRSGETTLEIKAYPGESARSRYTEEPFAFEYQIKGAGDDIFKDKLTIKIVKLEDILEISPQAVKYGDDEAIVRIRNVQNLKFENASLKIESVFFDGEETISLGPFESIALNLPVKTENIKNLAAGPYVVSSEVEVEGVTAKVEDVVDYVEQENIALTKTTSGWIIRTTKLTKTNEGNLAATARIEVTKNILTRLFTSSSIQPLSSERKGLFVYYRWEKELNPGESLTVDVRTNYTLPFVLIILILFIVIVVYLYSRTSVVVNKRCSFVKTKGGEFALKITLHVKARKSVENMELFDRIPMATKLYEKAGMPHKFDDKIGRLSWKIERLNAGEERVFSYIIYSTIRIFGRLELSPATAHFLKDGKSTYVTSNRTYFVSDVHSRF